jgi:predicted esterase
MPLTIGSEQVTLALAATEQAIHTPALALVTMLHRNVLIAHGGADAWANPDEAGLLAATLVASGVAPVVHVVEDAGHDLAEADDERIGAIAAALAALMEPRELPAVLVAIEQMGEGR